MNYRKYLEKAGVPAELHDAAVKSLEAAKERAKGLLWLKIKARLFMAKKLAAAIPWEGERLLDYRPDWAMYDVAPMLNITGHGDNVPWVNTPEGVRPAAGAWLNKDPNSEEYKQAVNANYWLKGTHPRSPESRAAWYKRNAGEYRAWELGEEVDFSVDGIHIYERDGVRVLHSGNAWFLLVKTKLIGKLNWQSRVGFEVDNLWSEDQHVQGWYPIPGYKLKAPVSHSSIPQFK